MKILKLVTRLISFALQLLLDVMVLFFLFALIGALWGRNTDEVLHKDGVPLFIHGDGFHTELYLPVKDSMGIINWMDWFADSTLRSKHAGATLVNFSWAEYDWTAAGIDQEPQSIGTVIEILFSPWNKSVMHVQWMNNLWPLKKPFTVKRFLTVTQYNYLIKYIKSGFVLNGIKPMNHTSQGKPAIRSYKGYYGFDYTYLSNRNYNSFNTCNQWTSDALNSCGIRNATFSPFGWGLFYQIKKSSHKEH